MYLCCALPHVCFVNVELLTGRFSVAGPSGRPRGLRRRSAAAHLLRLWVRIPPGGHGYPSVVSVLCCQVEVSATG